MNPENHLQSTEALRITRRYLGIGPNLPIKSYCIGGIPGIQSSKNLPKWMIREHCRVMQVEGQRQLTYSGVYLTLERENHT